ncbi:exonuclease V [Podospora conica]|nr:exonuclease V [Schizothecium conicum]
MASYNSDSDSDSYGYDLTLSDEEDLAALIDSVSATPQTATPQRAPLPPPIAVRTPRFPPPVVRPSKRRAPSVQSLDSDVKHAIAVHEAIDGISVGDLDFNDADLESTVSFNHAPAVESPVERPSFPPPVGARRSNSSNATASVHSSSLKSLQTQRKPAVPRVPPSSIISYPDLSRALEEAQKPDTSSSVGTVTDVSGSEVGPERKKPSRRLKNQVQMIREFRTFPKKPLSVSDLTAGAWCELQHFYTLTRRDGYKRQTSAMKAGSVVHEKLEREVFTPVVVELVKPVDRYGLKIWNIITGLRTLRDTGLTRELEVWGVIDGNIVNGIIDGLSYENPDPELEEDVVSSRGSQSSQNSSQHQLALGNKVIFITDVKTRGSKTAPSLVQVRGTLIQLFLYHRFLSEMASDRLNYLDVFKRYGVDPDETFSDQFMAQMIDLHEEVFFDDAATVTTDATTTEEFATAVSTPSKLGDPRLQENSLLRYRTLRSLIPLLKFEIQLTFPRGAATIGHIVAVEYRYRSRKPNDPDAGALICINSYYVEQEKLDEYLTDNMRWWRGEREPRGVQLDEGWKCRECEFAGECEWREKLEMEAYRKVKMAKAQLEAAGGRKDTLQW